MPIPIKQKPVPVDTCPVSDPTCSGAEQPTQSPEEPPSQSPEVPPSQPTQEQPAQSPEQSDGTEGIRTTLIPLPGRQTFTSQEQGTAAAPAPAAPQQQQQQQGPGIRNLVRFLNNPEGAMQNNDSAYLRTMYYSTDQANLVLKSAMNSSGYY